MDKSRTLFTSAKPLFLAITLPVIIMCVLGVVGSLLVTFFNYNGIHEWIGSICFIVIFMTVLFNPLFWIVLFSPLIYLLIRRSFSKAVLCFAILLSIHASFFLQLERYFLEATLPYFEYLKFTQDADDTKCMNSTVDTGDGKKLGICKSYIFDNAIWAGDSAEEKEIIYDSSDQIMLPFDRRSSTWRSVAEKLDLLSPLLGNRRQVCIQDAFDSAMPLGKHFYFVAVSNDVADKGCP